jgi:hypothetical protein
VAAAELGLSHQLCVAHVRKYVAKRSKSILEQAEKEWGDQEDGKLEKLEEDLGKLKGLLEDLPEGGTKEIGRLHRGCLWAEPPTRGRPKRAKEGSKKACAGYRMRMLSLELSEKWHKIQLYLRHPELKLDGTNNASERAISKSKVRYKSVEGMTNGVALTQWLYSGEDEHDLAKEIAA